MEEREENHQERLKQRLKELEEEWTAMKTGKSSSSAVSSITVEEAIAFMENSPRKLMLSLQHDQARLEAEITSPLRRKLFPDSDDDDDDDDETSTTSFSHSSCCSSNVKRVRKKEKEKKTKRGKIDIVAIVLFLLLVLVVLKNCFYHLCMDREINTLVPT